MALGVAEAESGFSKALEKCGTMESSGRIVGIVNVTGINMMWVSLGLKLLGYVFLVILLKFQNPLGFLPGDALGIKWMQGLQHWESFDTVTWLTAIVLYTIWVVVSVLRSNLHRGVPGVDQIFSRYGKVMRIVRPGDGWVNIDPRIVPSAIVSRKPLLMELGPIVSPAKENVKIETHGTIVFRVLDSFKLFEQGGFKTFFEQLQGLYASLMRDRILQFSARTFNQFMVEPARYAHDRGTSIDSRLERLEGSQLTIELVNELSEIGELDVSKMELSESSDPERRRILAALNELATRYGVEIIDYVPQGNLVEGDYFGQLAVDLVRSLQRLHQATNILADTLRQEIEQEVTARVSGIQRSGLEIDKLCGELESVKGTLQGGDERQSIIDATVKQMESVVEAIMAEYLGKVEALMSRIAAMQIDAAGIERYVTESEGLIMYLENELIEALPKVRQMVVDECKLGGIATSEDLAQSIMERSGIAAILEELIKEPANRSSEDAAGVIGAETASLDASALIARIQERLGTIVPSTGLRMEAYAPAEIEKKIAEITIGIGAPANAAEAN